MNAGRPRRYREADPPLNLRALGRCGLADTVRGMMRTAAVIVRQVIGLGLLCPAVLSCAREMPADREASEKSVSRDYVAAFIKLSRPHGYDPNDDARDDYAEACRLAVNLPRQTSGYWRYPTQWRTEERTDVEAWVVSNARALASLERGTHKATYWPTYDLGNGFPFPEGLGAFRHLVLALAARARIAAAVGRHDDAFTDILTCFRLQGHLARCPDVTSRLVADALRSVAGRAACQILSQEEVGPELLARFQEELAAVRDQGGIVMDFAGARLFVLHHVQRVFADDGHVPPETVNEILAPYEQHASMATTSSLVEVLDREAWGRLRRRRTAEQAQDYFERLDKAAEMSPWQLERDADGVRSGIERIQRENPLIAVLAPSLQVVTRAARGRVECDALMTVLAVFRCRVATGQLPVTLEELVAQGYLDVMPGDPYSDGPLIYKRTEGRFTLYSLGADSDDDGGTPSGWGEGPDGGDQVFWPVQEQAAR